MTKIISSTILIQEEQVVTTQTTSIGKKCTQFKKMAAMPLINYAR